MKMSKFNLQNCDKIAKQVTLLMQENDRLRKQNREFKDKWLKESTSTLNMIKDKAFIEAFGSVASEAEWTDENRPSVNTYKDERKEKVYNKVKEESDKKKRKKMSKEEREEWNEKLRLSETAQSLDRTTLRKRLHSRKNDSRSRYSKYAEIKERKRYCQLI